MNLNAILIYLSCIILIYIFGKIFYIPLKILFSIILNSIWGAFLIFVVNLIGNIFSFHIGLNIYTAAIVGILGIPGVILLLFINMFF